MRATREPIDGQSLRQAPAHRPRHCGDVLRDVRRRAGGRRRRFSDSRALGREHPLTLGAVVLVALLGHGTSSSVHWVELDGSTIRGRRLFTRKRIEQRVCDIVEAHGTRTRPVGPLEDAVLDFMLQTRDPGFVLIFRNGTRIPLVKADMTGLAAFFGQLAAQIKCERTAAGR